MDADSATCRATTGSAELMTTPTRCLLLPPTHLLTRLVSMSWAWRHCDLPIGTGTGLDTV